jgi:putative component of toxin-antitoxin plasmid stabilization module
MFEIRDYLTAQGDDPYALWLISLADRQARARIDWGPGYRIYYAQAGQRLILLLVGGDKRKQQADIEKAHLYWLDWQHRRKLK